MFTAVQIASLAGGALTMLVLGSLYVFGAIAPYMASYLYYQGEKDITVAQFSIIQLLSVMTINAGLPLPNFKWLSFSYRITAAISIIGVSATIFALSFCTSFVAYILLYGILFGIFNGYGYLAGVKNCFEHLPNRKGFCTGFCIMGYGLGSVIFNLILLQLINPNNEHSSKDTHRFSQQVANNVPYALKIISAVYLGTGLIGAALIIPNKKDRESKSLLETEVAIKKLSNPSLDPVESKSIKFYIENKIHVLILILGMSVPFGMFIAFNFKEYGETAISDDRFLTIVGSVSGFANGFSRTGWGFLMDKLDFKWISGTISFVQMLCCLAVYFSVENQYAYMVVVFVTCCCYGGNFGIYPTQTVRIFGKKLGSKIYWIVFLGFSIGGAIQFMLHSFLVESLGDSAFPICFIIFGVLNLLAIILVFTTDFKYNEEEREYLKKGPSKRKEQESLRSEGDLTE